MQIESHGTDAVTPETPATEPAPDAAPVTEAVSEPESKSESEAGANPEAALTASVEATAADPEAKGPQEGAQCSIPEVEEPKVKPPFPEKSSVNELQTRSLGSLQVLAAELGWRVNGSRSKHQLICELLSWMLQHGTSVEAEGFLEMQQESYGLLRYPAYNFMPLPEDVFVPVFAIKKFQIRPGQKLKVTLKTPREKEKFLAMDRILEIEGVPADDWQAAPDFEKLTATFPSQRLILETPKDASVSSRVMDLVAPLGKGQRALIVASPRSGKTMLLKDVARSIITNHKEVTLIILLLDERPEEVTDFEDTVATEIYSSTFDESPKRHSQVAELVLERAKRLVEMGKDVVILLDSITRLSRGYNALQGGKGRTMSGGMDSKALMKPKKFFGAARKVDEGGSLTIVATALVDTESRMDELIFEEFKGTGNMELILDRKIAERRLFPAINLAASGTRKEELLLDDHAVKTITALRRRMLQMPPPVQVEQLLAALKRFETNDKLVGSAG